MKEVQEEQNKILKQEEIVELIRKYRAENDKESLEKILESNQGLVKKLASKYYSVCTSMDFDDICQECNIAIYNSVKNYNIEKPTAKFSTYITKAMQNHVKSEINKKDKLIKLPEHIERLDYKYRTMIRKYEAKENKKPSEEQIKRSLKINSKQLKTLKELEYLNPFYLDKQIEVEGEEKMNFQSLISIKENNYEDIENQIDFKLMLYQIKKILKKHEYYIYYNLMISDEIKNSAELSKYLSISTKAMSDYKNRLEKLVKEKMNISHDKIDIKEIEKEELIPMSPKKICCYSKLKKDLDDLTYYFLYNKIENNYGFEEFRKKFSKLNEEEIKYLIDICDTVEEKMFNKEKQEGIYLKTKEKNNLPEIFNLDIKPNEKILYKNKDNQVLTK